MPKYFVAHGSLKLDKSRTIKTGGDVEMSAEEAEALDPQGLWLLPESKYLAIKRLVDAEGAPAKDIVKRKFEWVNKPDPIVEQEKALEAAKASEKHEARLKNVVASIKAPQPVPPKVSK